jgi:hypothetical protein
MLYDLDYSAYQAKGRHEPIFFPARLERGILYVPPAHEVMAMAAKEEN